MGLLHRLEPYSEGPENVAVTQQRSESKAGGLGRTTAASEGGEEEQERE